MATGNGVTEFLERLRSALRDAMRGVPLEPAAEETFQRERLDANIDRVRMLTPLLFLVHAVFIVVYWPSGAASAAGLAPYRLAICVAQAAAASLLAVGWLARLASRRVPALLALRDLGPDAFAFLYVLLGATLSANGQHLQGNQNSYVMALLAMATILRQQSQRAALTLGVGLVAYLAGVWVIQPSAELRLSALGPSVVVTLLAWMISRANSLALRRTVGARLTILAQSEELAEQARVLEELNQELGERVEARAGEIAKLHTELRVKVVDRSRELLRAIRAIDRPPAREQLAAGSVFAERVEVHRLLGRGGMGEVYLGDDRATGQRVALKVMRPEISVSREALARFVSEAAAAAAVDHAAVVRTLHVDLSAEGRFYQLIEYVEGWTLADEIECGTFDHAGACRIGAVVAGALAAAHARGVVHRDVKPSNVMLTDRPPGVRLVDFGASKFVRDEDTRLTAENQVVGTPLYMAPEQVLSPQAVRTPADVYALGAVLFEMLVGRAPFATVSARSLLVAQVAEAPAVLADLAEVPSRLSELVASALAKDPAARPSARAVADVLTGLADAAGAPAAELVRTPVRTRGTATTVGVGRDAWTTRAARD